MHINNILTEGEGEAKVEVEGEVEGEVEVEVEVEGEVEAKVEVEAEVKVEDRAMRTSQGIQNSTQPLYTRTANGRRPQTYGADGPKTQTPKDRKVWGTQREKPQNPCNRRLQAASQLHYFSRVTSVTRWMT